MRVSPLILVSLLFGTTALRSGSDAHATGAAPATGTRGALARGGDVLHGRVAPTVLRGRVLLPDDGSPIGLRVYLATPAHFDSTDVDVAGAFGFELPRLDCDSIDLRIDAADPAARRYHPVRLRVSVRAVRDTSESEPLRVLLVPTSFTVSGGTYSGTTVPITIDAALAGPQEHARYWRVSRTEHGYGVPIGWPEERFPLPVAVSGYRGALRTADSASFWAIARQLERDFGRTLFRPISIDSARSEGWSVTMTLNALEDTPGVTFITYNGLGDLYDATISIRSSVLLTDERVVTHELLHALGFGHSVSWYSVMGSPFQSASRATAADIAYGQLFYRIRRMHIEQRATHGILASSAEARRRLPVMADSRACPLGEPELESRLPHAPANPRGEY